MNNLDSDQVFQPRFTRNCISKDLFLSVYLQKPMKFLLNIDFNLLVTVFIRVLNTLTIVK
jgi:hypothetical protein